MLHIYLRVCGCVFVKEGNNGQYTIIIQYHSILGGALRPHILLLCWILK